MTDHLSELSDQLSDAAESVGSGFLHVTGIGSRLARREADQEQLDAIDDTMVSDLDREFHGRGEEAVECRALSGFAAVLHRYHYFSSGVPFLQVPDGASDVAQWVAPVDDRNHFSGFEELPHDDQVVLAQMRQEREQPMAHEP